MTPCPRPLCGGVLVRDAYGDVSCHLCSRAAVPRAHEEPKKFDRAGIKVRLVARKEFRP